MIEHNFHHIKYCFFILFLIHLTKNTECIHNLNNLNKMKQKINVGIYFQIDVKIKNIKIDSSWFHRYSIA